MRDLTPLLQRAGYYESVNGLSHMALTSGSFEHLRALLTGYGNTLSTPHATALYALLGLMTKMAQGQLRGRWAFGLPTGMGKTSAIISWCATLHRLGAAHVSVAVSASKVEALCQLKRDLIAHGVPEKSIGLLHSYRHDPAVDPATRDGYASLPSTDDNEDRQIMLVTHARVRSSAGLTRFNNFRGKPRDLLIYDESLLVSESLGLSFRDIKGALGYLSGRYDGVEKFAELIAYLTQCRDRIAGELSRQKDGGTIPVAFRLPTLTDDKASEFRSLLGRQAILEPIAHLLELVSFDLRVVDTGQGGLIHYSLAVPRELSNILVLDASYPVRALVHLDSSIKDAEKHLPEVRRIGVPLAKLKDFSSVTLHQMFAGGGRDTMRQDFDKPEDQRRITKEVTAIIKDTPADEAVLVFVFKQRPGERTDYRNTLLSDLHKAGVDTEATVTVTEGDTQVTRRRINVATWGMETSLSCFSHCRVVILAGVLQRSPVDLAGAFLGQTDDLLGAVKGDDISRLALTEVCHVVYQALSRGACRVIEDGKARPMRGYLIHRDLALQGELSKVMPGAVWQTWEPKHGEARNGIIAATAVKLADHLRRLPATVDKVSTKRLKIALGLDDLHTSTFKAAVREVVSLVPWRSEGRSLTRLFGAVPT